MNKNFIILGIHSSGKTTVLNIFYKHGFYPHFEIGWILRNQLPDMISIEGEIDFDNKVFEYELLRDEFIIKNNNFNHCIETWHIGNLAYAKYRKAKNKQQYFEILNKQLFVFQPTVIILKITMETFKKRKTLNDMEVEKLYFSYSKIEKHYLKIIYDMKIPHILINNNGSKKSLEDKIKKILYYEG